RNVKWISILLSWLVICHEVEPRAIPPSPSQIESKVQNESALDEELFNNQTVSDGHLVYTLPDGKRLRIVFHVDQYGFYPETID
ncbi:hypothetical protein KR026_010728, partial [Drosophila bipectinata]